MDILNITNIDYDKTIKEVIKQVKDEYEYLTSDRTCMLYSSFINDKLKEKRVISRIISTKDFNIDYEHRFVLAKSSKNIYLIDLTYRQFFDEVPEEFEELDNNGYMIIDNELLKDYIFSFCYVDINKNIDSLFFKKI